MRMVVHYYVSENYLDAPHANFNKSYTFFKQENLNKEMNKFEWNLFFKVNLLFKLM